MPTEIQPPLPVNEPPKTLEYAPSEGDPEWLIGDWRGVSKEFTLAAHEVLDWHNALAGQGRPWMVIRRIFSVAPLWGDALTQDDMRDWKWSDLAVAIGVSESVLKKDLELAVEFWKKTRMSLSATRSAESSKPSVKRVDTADGGDLPDFEIHQSFSEAQIAACLTPFRFNHIKSADDRMYAANRVLELRKLLEDKYKRESARQLIQMELSMNTYESTLSGLKVRLDTLGGYAELSASQSKEIQEIAASIEKQEKALTKLSETYHRLANELGGDEIEAGEARRIAIGTASHLVEAHRKFYETGERVLIDGMFTAEEIVWLTTPLSIRPNQYRPDIVIRVREACEPENLWDKDYKPSVIQREACRRLAKIVAAFGDELEPPVIEGIDDLPEQSAVDEDDPADASAAIIADSQPFDDVPRANAGEPPAAREELVMGIS